MGVVTSARPTRYAYTLVRPGLVLAAVVATAVQLPTHQVTAPELTTGLFLLVAAAAIGSLFSWSRLPQWQQVLLMGAYAVCAAVLLPLAQTTGATVFAFAATGFAGLKLTSRRAAVAVAVICAVTCMVAVWVVRDTSSVVLYWPWWLSPVVAVPVWAGIAERDRAQALRSAELATAEAERASESEAREAALLERARIAREIHDVLGHSLSGIAIQLDMADALHSGGREAEANLATRRARALAVGSITETRRAIQALREDTLPLTETLRLLALEADIPLEVGGEAGPVAVETAQTVIRVAQEALTNSVKYASGGPRTMKLDFTGDTVALTVTNGPGAAAGPAEIAGGTGMGLVGMRERAALLGGALRAGPAGTGWSVELEVPK